MKIISPAKLTLSLDVLDLREDGYHSINAEMVSLDLADVLEIEENPKTEIEMVGAKNVSVDDIELGENNLVYKALELVGKTAKVKITKSIPSGAGLGGGSSNAAAILRWAQMVDSGLAVTHEMAAGVGADVAFCLAGGRARVGGMGEVIEPLEFVPATYTLLIPTIKCETAEIYQAWDELGGLKGSNGNDLEQAALSICPELERWRERLAEISEKVPRLAGSGSTWFVEGEYPTPDTIIAHTLEADII